MGTINMTMMAKSLTCITLALMAFITVGATAASAHGHDNPIDQPPPRGPSTPVEQPGAETP